jgi:hypothetical protein
MAIAETWNVTVLKDSPGSKEKFYQYHTQAQESLTHNPLTILAPGLLFLYLINTCAIWGNSSAQTEAK